ncbi:PREDICTED: uncharacterized protein LOC106127848 [Papilio xuthus]|uniref:Uncharacterized protein LOC106127848 n=1 Tax=Papilio xuthus TaxID=66420 RepID=A0AAJ6ZY86_PAPXU|nr:PREDICTED: uncharacterized protein LOC106127848 [Papilio xuthus]
MDTASIRIKFTPMVKVIKEKNLTYSLEITPEVIYVDNVDKIEWKKENNLIEYIVPMKHRIVIRKVTPNNNEESNKIYYSCVDLLHTRSINNTELGSGDVSRIISDNVILKSIIPDVRNNEKCKITLANNHRSDLEREFDKKGNNLINIGSMKQILQEKINLESSLICLNCDTKDRNKTKKNCTQEEKSGGTQISNTGSDNNESSVDKGSGDDNDLAESTVVKLQSIATLTNLNSTLDQKSTITYFLSPDTNPTPPLKTVYQNDSYFNTNMYYTLTTQTFKLQEDAKVETDKNTYKDNTPDLRVAELKVLPALRYSYFKQIMEKEMLPLRVKLNEIINKCIPLGLKKSEYLQSFVYSNNSSNKCNYRENQFTSNRVVYSVVFNK